MMEFQYVDLSKALPIGISLLALIVSIGSLLWNVDIEFYKRKSNIEVWQKNNFYDGFEDNRTQVNLIIRNLSPRPSAVLEIYVLGKNGEIVQNLESTENINLPIKIESWGVQKISFRISSEIEEKMENIQVQTMDDERIIVKRLNGKKWHK